MKEFINKAEAIKQRLIEGVLTTDEAFEQIEDLSYHAGCNTEFHELLNYEVDYETKDSVFKNIERIIGESRREEIDNGLFEIHNFILFLNINALRDDNMYRYDRWGNLRNLTVVDIVELVDNTIKLILNKQEV